MGETDRLCQYKVSSVKEESKHSELVVGALATVENVDPLELSPPYILLLT